MDMALDGPWSHSPNVLRQPLATERLVVMARRDHPEVGAKLDMETYLRQQHILVTSSRQGATLLDAELNRLGMQRRIRLRCQDYLAASQIVAETDLILTLPASRRPDRVGRVFDNRIVAAPTELPLAENELSLYWHASADGDPANCWIREQLRQVFSDATTSAA
jgi:DNA-binding transcriptional LysR family regulator